jgi:hypothetical protein
MRTAISILALLLGPALLMPARAANINDLNNNYAGVVHHSTLPAFEEIEIEIEVTDTQPNGNFTAVIFAVPVSGKVSSTGAITFSGKSPIDGGTVQFKKGVAQLSATGDYIVGSFQLKVENTKFFPSGKYTFHVHPTLSKA